MLYSTFGVVTDSTGIMRYILRLIGRCKMPVKYNCKKYKFLRISCLKNSLRDLHKIVCVLLEGLIYQQTTFGYCLVS
ncbi:hypothetical protein SaSA20_0783b [Streptococcus agalactiae]|nr:hypothetical protein SaSA20_0783b [Streptococcus agalactiae]